MTTKEPINIALVFEYGVCLLLVNRIGAKLSQLVDGVNVYTHSDLSLNFRRQIWLLIFFLIKCN